MTNAVGPNSPSWQHLYRALLRSSSAAVRFSRPAAKNTRRYLRDDFAAALVTQTVQEKASDGSSQGKGKLRARQAGKQSSLDNVTDREALRRQLAQQTHDTLAFHLSSSLLASSSSRNGGGPARSDQDSPLSSKRASSRLAHRIISNLSSLTYHHLSPHTPMQSRVHLTLRRTIRKPTTRSAISSALSPSSSIDEGEVTVNEAHMKLSFLFPTFKPVRGPANTRMREWDGQDPDRTASEGRLRQMEAELQEVKKALEGGKRLSPKQVEELRGQAEKMKKKIKSAQRALEKAAEEEELKSVPIGLLAELVAKAQDEEGVLLGKERWSKRAKGEFLPP